MRAAMVEFEDYFPDCGRKFDGTEKTCSVKEHCNKMNHWELKAKIYVENLSITSNFCHFYKCVNKHLTIISLACYSHGKWVIPNSHVSHGGRLDHRNHTHRRERRNRDKADSHALSDSLTLVDVDRSVNTPVTDMRSPLSAMEMSSA